MSEESKVVVNQPAETKAPEPARQTSANAAPAPAGAAAKAAADAAQASAKAAKKKPAAKKAAKKTGRKATKTAAKKVAKKAAAPRKTAKKASKRAVKAGATAAKTAARNTRAYTRQSTQTMENVMTQGKTQFDRLTQDAAKSGKEQVDAFIESGNLFMRGFEDITKTCINLAQASAEKNTQAIQSLLSCKTISEFAETQNKWAQQNFDDFMANSTKISELSVRVATEALEPINDQLSKNLRKANASLAA